MSESERTTGASGLETHEDIFAAAIQLTGAERDAYLAEACGDDAQRRRLDDMLALSEEADSFFNELTERPRPPVTDDGPGSVVGPYKLLQQIGEGGFGTVFMAEQREPISRRVAIKLVKAGMDTRSVIARFEAERQALAMMDHPNIAKVYDAGATGSGRPYFVMELVRGVPILRFCDEQRYDTRQRLDLFLELCSAVNHAHQKGIIHRDLKPSNILVTLHGDRPVPKIIDFGIAKATQQRLTDKTLFTRFEQMVGTPLYMSPEQAAHSGLDVDTRTDIYALGIILYELLAGKPPFDPRSLLEAGYDEMRRIIREDEPPRPSTRVSTLEGEERAILTTTHRAEPYRLGRLIKGDLDWIVMKAIDKDRSRRYETANGFAVDIRRFLHEEPVTARPPSTAYKMRKFVRRNKAACVGVVAVVLALLIGVVGISWGMIQARSERERAEIERERAENERDRATAIKGLLASTLGSIDSAKAREFDTKLLKSILEDASREIEIKHFPDHLVAAELLYIIGDVYMGIGEYDTAQKHLLEAVEYYDKANAPITRDELAARDALGLTYAQNNMLKEAELVFLDVLDRHGNFPQSDELDRLRTETNLARTLSNQGKFAEAEIQLRKVLAKKIALMGDDDQDVLKCRNNLGVACYMQGGKQKAREALEQWEMVLESRIGELGKDHRLTIGARINVANAHHRLEIFAGPEAEISVRESIYKDCIGGGLPETDYYRVGATFTHAEALQSSDDRERLREAGDLYREILDLSEKGLRSEDHPDILRARQGLAGVLQKLEEWQAARDELEMNAEILNRVRRIRPESIHNLKMLIGNLISLGNLENAFWRHGQEDGTPGPADEEGRKALGRQRDALQRAWELVQDLPGPVDPLLVDAGIGLGEALLDLDDADGARTVVEEALARATEDSTLRRVGILKAKRLLGDAYVRLERWDDVVALLDDAVKEMREEAKGFEAEHGIHKHLEASRQNLDFAKKKVAERRAGSTPGGALAE